MPCHCGAIVREFINIAFLHDLISIQVIFAVYYLSKLSPSQTERTQIKVCLGTK